MPRVSRLARLTYVRTRVHWPFCLDDLRFCTTSSRNGSHWCNLPKVQHLKLAKLHFLGNELDSEFAVTGLKQSIFYRHGDIWSSLRGTQMEASDEKNLNESLRGDLVATGETTQSAWFYLQQFDCVVRLQLLSSGTMPAPGECRKRLSISVERSSNAYKVAHNPLTQLLSRDKFELLLAQSVALLPPASVAGERLGATVPRVTALLALDIDHFKQVNDDRGHPYGNKVLQAFAMRLESEATKINDANLEANVMVGHPSGEEFLVLVEGRVTTEQIRAWAEQFRESICSTALPSDTEWAQMGALDGLETLNLPPAHERKITASIGISVATTLQRDSREEAMSQIDKSDTALYRAKTGGRNKAIFFSDIVLKCGRVLQYDALSKIIALDLGTNVGLSLGQEFIVYADPFTGAKDFSVSDGRTTRRIGTYPKVTLTHITVFDVQKELSFAFFSDAQSASDIPVGAHLEAIPLGSIRNLPVEVARFFAGTEDTTRVGDMSAVRIYTFDAIHRNDAPFTLVFRLQGEQEYSRRFGHVALKSVLTKLFQIVLRHFRLGTAAGIPDTASVCIVGRSQSYDEAAVFKVIADVTAELPGIRIAVGAFTARDNWAKDTTGAAQNNFFNAIEYARFAASDHASSSGSVITHFSLNVAVRMLDSLNAAWLYPQGIADYERLASIGVVSAELDNMGAVLYGGVQNHERAVQLHEKALSAMPTDRYLRSNLGVACHRASDYERGLIALSNLSDDELTTLRADRPYSYLVYALLLSMGRSQGWRGYSEERFLRLAPDALLITPWGDSPLCDPIREALKAQQTDDGWE